MPLRRAITHTLLVPLAEPPPALMTQSLTPVSELSPTPMFRDPRTDSELLFQEDLPQSLLKPTRPSSPTTTLESWTHLSAVLNSTTASSLSATALKTDRTTSSSRTHGV